MQDKGKDNFEGLIQKTSEQYSYEYDESVWNLIEDALEKKEKKRRFFVYFVWIISVFVVIALALTGIYFYSNSNEPFISNTHNSNKSDSTLNSHSTLNSNENFRDSEIEGYSKKSAVQRSAKSVYSTDRNVSQPDPENEVHSPSTYDLSRSKHIYESFKKSIVIVDSKHGNSFNLNESLSSLQNPHEVINEQDAELDDAKLNVKETSINLSVSDVISDKEIDTSKQWKKHEMDFHRDEYDSSKTDESAAERTEIVVVKSAILEEKADTLRSNIDSNVSLAFAEKKRKEKDSSVFSRVSLLFSVTPDLSFTQLVDVSKLQLSAYLGGEFSITRNFSALLGVAYSNKSYLARGSDYTPGKPKFWTGGVKPREVSGTCNVLDMSVALRYYHTFSDTKKTRYFVELGSSSYLMMKEHYDFIYSNPNPALIQQWNVQSGIVYSFSVMNFSLGVERKIKEHWSIQASPKFQMPLSALGWGSVKFSSAGLNMTIKYSF